MIKKINCFLIILTLLSCTIPDSSHNDNGKDKDECKANCTELHLEHISIFMTDPPNDTGIDDKLIELINGAQAGEGNLDISFYGFNREKVIVAIENAIARGVHVRFVGDKDSAEEYYDGYKRIARALDDNFTNLNRFEFPETGFADFKLANSGAIMHNKFVLANDSDGNKWLYTGSTNCTDSGFELNNNNSNIC